MKLAVVILAAGKGTRMRSNSPKVLHLLAGQPIISYSVSLALRLSPEPPVLIVGHGAEQVRETVGDRARYVIQEQQLGTGHAVLQAEPVLKDDADLVLTFFADMPLLTADTLRQVVAAHGRHSGPISMLSVIADDPRGFGRVVRDEMGEVIGIVEEVEATPEQRAIRELNVGVYCFDAPWLWSALRRLKPSPQKQEYYLTDTIAMAVDENHTVAAVVTEDRSEALGINTRIHLSEAERILRRRMNKSLMISGVTMIDPETTYIHPDVVVGPDSTLWPGACLFGQTTLGSNCEIGPGAVLTDVILADNCRVGAHVVLTGVKAEAGTVFSSSVFEADSNG